MLKIKGTANKWTSVDVDYTEKTIVINYRIDDICDLVIVDKSQIRNYIIRKYSIEDNDKDFSLFDKHIKEFIQDNMYFYRRMDDSVLLLEWEKAQIMYREEADKHSYLKGSSRQTKSEGKQSQRLMVAPPLGMDSRHQQSASRRCS